MSSEVEIREIVWKIVETYHPERIVLFGSYARGETTAVSDVDLIVVMPFTGLGMRMAAEILKRIQPRIPLDLIVRTPEQVRQRLAWGDTFLREVMEQGQVLYEAADG